jgi:ABC-type transporter Mla subunit MlaD
VRTLSDNRDALFDSLDNLQTFTTALADVDSQVGQFNSNLSAVAQQLAGERQDLANAINLLTKALGDVATFVRDNTTLVQTNVDKLADVTLTLVQQRQALAEVLDTAPAALENLSHAYNPDTGTLDTRDNSSAFLSPEVLACQVLASAGKLQIGGINIGDPTALLGLPPTDAICARLLSGDANNDGKADDVNGNGIPDLQELETQLFGGGGGTSAGGGSASLPGLPAVTSGSSR